MAKKKARFKGVEVSKKKRDRASKPSEVAPLAVEPTTETIVEPDPEPEPAAPPIEPPTTVHQEERRDKNSRVLSQMGERRARPDRQDHEQK